MYEKAIKRLAKGIRKEALGISKDSIAKTCFIEPEGEFEISVTDDSGHRNIIVGDVRSGSKFGYAYLYVENENADGKYHMFKNFPPIRDIEKRLKSILARKDIEQEFYDTAEYRPQKGISGEALMLKLSVDLRNYLEVK